jgi:hypothetical protein
MLMFSNIWFVYWEEWHTLPGLHLVIPSLKYIVEYVSFSIPVVSSLTYTTQSIRHGFEGGLRDNS